VELNTKIQIHERKRTLEMREEDKEEDNGDEGEEVKEEDIGDEGDKEKNPLTKQEGIKKTAPSSSPKSSIPKMQEKSSFAYIILGSVLRICRHDIAEILLKVELNTKIQIHSRITHLDQVP
jgi:hypothetical protein